MDRHQFAFILSQMIYRVREFPPEALSELFSALGTIEHKYDLLPRLSEEEKKGIEVGLADVEAGRVVPWEEVRAKWDHLLKDFDRDAAGKADFEDAASRVRKLLGEDQGDVADIMFAFINESRYDDIPPPPKKK